MLTVCPKHVKEGINGLIIPHVKKVTDGYTYSCLFCNQKAEIQIFYSIPFSKLHRKNKNNSTNLNENDIYYQYYD
ncbi:hypothetical protein J2S09_004999 [Bacillus fengqiuensis]|nr:hypothetical protein [Bacillus fengqiuensis]